MGVLAAMQAADFLAIAQPQDHVGVVPAGDAGVAPATRGTARGSHLGDHAALLVGWPRRQPWFRSVRPRPRLRSPAKPRILRRIRRIQAFLVGEDEQGFGFDEVRDQGAEGIVVTELISSVMTVSFSLMIGTTPSASSSVVSVERALR